MDISFDINSLTEKIVPNRTKNYVSKFIEHDTTLQLFSESLIVNFPFTAVEVLGYSSKLRIGLGWHYLLDIIWILRKLAKYKNIKRILDAGGGNGLLQYILAAYGYEVVSVDGFYREPNKEFDSFVTVKKSGASASQEIDYVKRYNHTHSGIEIIRSRENISAGEIEFHCSKLSSMQFIADDEFDAVVSLSALEHNSAKDLFPILKEIRRVAKKDAPLLLTLSTARYDRSEFHEPSFSYLYCEHDLKNIYNISDDCLSNFDQRDEFYEDLRSSFFLRRYLGLYYFNSDKSCMPKGLWDVPYLPFGLSKLNLK